MIVAMLSIRCLSGAVIADVEKIEINVWGGAPPGSDAVKDWLRGSKAAA